MTNQLIKSAEQLFAEVLETLKRKNTDYAGSAASMRNFRISSEISHVPMPQGILTRLADKVTRIGNLLTQDAQVKEETIHDTIQDLIGYAAILSFAISESKTETVSHSSDDTYSPNEEDVETTRKDGIPCIECGNYDVEKEECGINGYGIPIDKAKANGDAYCDDFKHHTAPEKYVHPVFNIHDKIRSAEELESEI